MDPPPLNTTLHAVEYMNAETVDYLGADIPVDSSPLGRLAPNTLRHWSIAAS